IETERRDLVEHVGARPRVGEASALDEHGIDGNGRFAGFVAGRVGARLAALAGTALRRIGRRVARGRTRIELTRAHARLAGTRARFVGVACRRVFGGRCDAAAAGFPGHRGDVAAAPRAGPGGGATLRRGGGLGGVRIEAPARAYEEETEGAQRMTRHASEYATPPCAAHRGGRAPPAHDRAEPRVHGNAPSSTTDLAGNRDLIQADAAMVDSLRLR